MTAASQFCHFKGDEIDIGFHCTGDLLDVKTLIYVLGYLIIRKHQLSGEYVCLILDAAGCHVKDVELL